MERLKESHTHNGNGNGNGKNGNGHLHAHLGNGHNGNGHDVLLAPDRFEQLDLLKPRLFPSSERVIKETGIRRNLLLFILFLLSAVYVASLPLSSTTVDRNALVTPHQRTDLTSPKDGFVRSLLVDEGQTVKKGELLLKVESLRDRNSLRETRLEVFSLERELSVAWTEAQIASLKLDEAIQLKKLGSVKDFVVQEAFLRNQASQRKVESLIFKLEQAREKERFLKKAIGEGELRAPFEGVVISDPKLKEKAFVKEGEFLITLARQGSQLECLIKEGDYSRISIGGKAKIKFYAFPEAHYEGRVVGIKPFGEALHKPGIQRRAVKVLVEWERAPEEIRNGMSAKVAIEAKPQSFLGRFYHELF